MIGTICLALWMVLIVSDIWRIKKRLDRLEWDVEIDKLSKSGVDNGNENN